MFKNKWKRRYIELRQNYNKLKIDQEKARQSWYLALDMINSQLDTQKHKNGELKDLRYMIRLYEDKYGEYVFEVPKGYAPTETREIDRF